jgi:hypothetical protein
MGMTVKELIEQLSKLPQDLPILWFADFGMTIPIKEVVHNPDEVLIGEEIPPECHTFDYKYED